MCALYTIAAKNPLYTSALLLLFVVVVVVCLFVLFYLPCLGLEDCGEARIAIKTREVGKRKNLCCCGYL